MSEHALREMILSSLEAYCIGGPGGKAGIEIWGNLWGYHRPTHDETIIFVDAVSVSLAAKGKIDRVVPHPGSQKLKSEVIERWYPQFSLIGNFHSHPYPDKRLKEVASIPGFEFSDQDFVYYHSDDEVWQCAGGTPLFLVMTICELERVREGITTRVRDNVVQFDIGNYRFWLNACVGYEADFGEREITGNKHSPVLLEIPYKYNIPGDRLQL
jgi:hypothetical protein